MSMMDCLKPLQSGISQQSTTRFKKSHVLLGGHAKMLRTTKTEEVNIEKAKKIKRDMSEMEKNNQEGVVK